MSSMLAVKTGPAYAGVLGIGAYRPVRSVDNEEICAYIDSSDAWIRERTGIVSRGWAGPQETVVSMATAAGGKAIAAAGLQPEQIGFVLVATITHGYQTPSAAVEIAYELGASGAAAVDLSAACSGFCHGVAMANDMVRGGSAEYVLVIGVEKLMDFVDRADRSDCSAATPGRWPPPTWSTWASPASPCPVPSTFSDAASRPAMARPPTRRTAPGRSAEGLGPVGGWDQWAVGTSGRLGPVGGCERRCDT